MRKPNTSRLATMMDFLGVTGRELANALHVDYSLVSKWRNNSRKLSSKSNHLLRAAEYFLELDERTDYQHVRKALGDQYDDINSADHAKLCVYLSRWLSETTSIGAYAPIIRSNPQQKVYTAQFDVYENDIGRRNAVNRFLDHALSLPPGQEMFLLSQEDMSWMLEDREFLVEWREKLMEAVSRRTSITIIHTLDRDLKDLTAVLTQWLPLHMSGRLRSYFHPRYTESAIKRSMFILKGHVALIGSQTEASDRARYTSYFTDFSTVQQCEALFAANLSECRPLFAAHSLVPAENLYKILHSALQQSDNTYVYSDLPMFAAMPADVVSGALQDAGLGEDALRIIMSHHRNLVEDFALSLRNLTTRHACDLLSLQHCITHGEDMVSAELSLIAERTVLLSPIQQRNLVQHLVALLEQHSSYELGFITPEIQQSIPHTRIWAQENGRAAATTISSDRFGPFAIVASEPTIVSALYAFCEDLWISLPRVNRERSYVLARLKKLLQDYT